MSSIILGLHPLDASSIPLLPSHDSRKRLQTCTRLRGVAGGGWGVAESPSAQGHRCGRIRTFSLWGRCSLWTRILLSRHDSTSECLLVNVLQLKNLAGMIVKEDCKM